MTKSDKEFGEWKATAVVNGISVKRYERGFSYKKRNQPVERVAYPLGTTTKMMSDKISQIILNGYCVT